MLNESNVSSRLKLLPYLKWGLSVYSWLSIGIPERTLPAPHYLLWCLSCNALKSLAWGNVAYIVCHKLLSAAVHLVKNSASMKIIVSCRFLQLCCSVSWEKITIVCGSSCQCMELKGTADNAIMMYNYLNNIQEKQTC